MLPSGVRRADPLALRAGRRTVHETDAEIRHHMALRVDQLMARGLSPAEAQAEAERRFGGSITSAARDALVDAARHRDGRLTMIARLDALRTDLRYALRQLRRAPGFTAALILTFALGIGANATMFGIVDRLLLRPPALLRDPDRVGRVYLFRPRSDGTERIDNNLSYLRYTELAAQARTLDRAAAMFMDASIVGVGTEARVDGIALMSASAWPMFDVQPVVGRFFGPDEDRPPEGAPVAVLSYGTWMARYAGSPDVIGRPMRIGARVYTIIGVAPRRFNGIWTSRIAAYVPITAMGLEMFGTPGYATDHGASWLEVIAHRRPDATHAAVDADLTLVFRRSRAAEVTANPSRGSLAPEVVARTRAELAPVLFDRGPKMGSRARVATWLAGVSAIVLLIACANVANLLLARALHRRREVAVRVALGVGRVRLGAQLLVESLVLSILGGAAGLVLARWAGGILGAIMLPDIDWSLTPPFDGRILAFTATAAVITGLLTGVAPVAQAVRTNLNAALKTGERDGGGVAATARLRATLLVGQAALSVALLIGAGLFLESLRNVHAMQLGWDPSRIVLMSPDLRGTSLTPAERLALRQRLVDRAREVPGVSHVATTFGVPFYTTLSEDVFVPGIDSATRQNEFVVNPVSGDYFATMGTRVLRGRVPSDDDRADRPLVVAVSQSMGKMLWKERDPIGQCLRVGADTAPCREVVGVVQDIVRGDLRNDMGLQVYIPDAQYRDRGRALYVRTEGDARQLAPVLQRELQALMPGTGYIDARPMTQVLDPLIRPWMLGASMLSVFGGLALVLAAIGLYGVIAYQVAQRRHEMGVRIALGASGREVTRLVLGQGMRLAIGGGALGVALALAVGPQIQPLLFAVSARDPAVITVAVLAIVLTAVAACVLPARRATRVDPAEALRSE